MKHSTFIRVRYADTDRMGVVYNGNYFTYFEIGRTELMRSMGLAYSKCEELGYMLPLTEAKANYISPAFYDDELEINAELVYENKASIKFVYNILHDRTLIAQGHTIHIFVNAGTMKPVKPPKIFIETVEAYKNREADAA